MRSSAVSRYNPFIDLIHEPHRTTLNAFICSVTSVTVGYVWVTANFYLTNVKSTFATNRIECIKLETEKESQFFQHEEIKRQSIPGKKRNKFIFSAFSFQYFEFSVQTFAGSTMKQQTSNTHDESDAIDLEHYRRLVRTYIDMVSLMFFWISRISWISQSFRCSVATKRHCFGRRRWPFWVISIRKIFIGRRIVCSRCKSIIARCISSNSAVWRKRIFSVIICSSNVFSRPKNIKTPWICSIQSIWNIWPVHWLIARMQRVGQMIRHFKFCQRSMQTVWVRQSPRYWHRFVCWRDVCWKQWTIVRWPWTVMSKHCICPFIVPKPWMRWCSMKCCWPLKRMNWLNIYRSTLSAHRMRRKF